jgi:dTDP-4-dehydrorhamnose 3,5-epimerase
MAEIEELSSIGGAFLVRPVAHGDDRGRFVETYRREWFPAGREMVQANRSEKVAESLVGLHFHRYQADYWTLGSGVIRVVLVDLRTSSSTVGAVFSIDLRDGDLTGIYIPPGVAHGFATHADSVLHYMVDNYYDPADELGVAFDDPDLAIDWGVDNPVVSARDRSNPRRRDLPSDILPA